jgi:transglutaminase-like putative cysteine protease
MRPRWLLLVCASWLACAPAWAQAPKITPSGDPSIRNDTLYSLAVDPRNHPGESAVLLLDDGVIRYEADGTGTETYRQVTQILTPDAVEEYAEREFTYAPGHQRLTVNWIRVVRPDGTVLSEAPSQAQDADIPASLTDPVYTDTKVRRYSLSGVAPGTLVDWSYTVEEVKPFLPGDFFTTWSIHTGAFTRRSRFIVDLPASVVPHLVERNIPFRPRESVIRGRHSYLWTAHDVQPVTPEEFMADSNGVFMTIGLSAPITWETIGSWYSGLSRDRYAVDHGIREKLRSLLKAAPTPDDTLRALQRWVAQDIRYVSIALGLGGYQPRMPAEVLATGYGDCKDKTTLFVAAARALGFRAYPVLLNSGGSVARALPSLSQFNHAIAMVERSEGRVYVDLTAELVPYGELPESDQGQFGLIVYPDGTSEQVTLPESAASANLNETRIAGSLSAEGYITAMYEERGLGSRQYSLRSLFLVPADSSHRAEFARAIATKLYPGAEADSLVVFEGRDLAADPRVALRIVRGLAARTTGNNQTLILSLPLTSMRGMADAAAALESRRPRRFPIDAAQIIGPAATFTDITLTLPPGWRAELPRDVEARGKWGSYTARYDQQGTTLHIVRSLEGTRGIYPPEDLPDLTGWLRAVAQDDVAYLVIERNPTP